MRAILDVILIALDLYWWVIIASAIFSWLFAFNVVNPRNQVVSQIGNALYQMTEPVLRPIRRFMPNLGGLDLSPTTEVLVEESVLGWKEYEMEVVRDRADNCIIICAIENLELVARSELMRRNSYHTRYPKEIGRAIHLRGALVRRINRLEREREDRNR